MKERIFRLYILLLLFLITGNRNFAQTYIIQPDSSNGKDAGIFSLSCTSSWAQTYGYCANTNTNAWGTYSASAWTYFGSLGVERGLLAFDLSSITKSGANLYSAQLVLSKFEHKGDADNQSYIQRITSSWNESTVTWSTMPSVVTTDLTNTQNRVWVAPRTQSSEQITVDLTAMVKYWLDNPSQNFGFMHSMVNEATYRSMSIYLSENANVNLRPKLILTFYNNVYYSKATGNLNDLSTWGKNTDGTGQSPSNFSSDSTLYYVSNSSSFSLDNDWTIQGVSTRLILGTNGAQSITLPSQKKITCKNVIVQNNTNVTGKFFCDSLFPLANTIFAITDSMSSKYISFGNSSKLTIGTVLQVDSMYNSGVSTVEYNGNSTQYLSKGVYSNLLLSGSGNKTLSGNVVVGNTLTMNNDIDCNNFILTLGKGTTQIGTLVRNAGIVKGKFSRWYASNTSFNGTTGVFPVGGNGNYRPIELGFSSVQAGGTVTVEYIPQTTDKVGLPVFETSPTPLFIDQISANCYWVVSTKGLSGGSYTLKATANGIQGVSGVQNLRLLQRADATSDWSLPGASATGSGTTSAPVMSRTGLSSIDGYYSVGADKLENPIP